MLFNFDLFPFSDLISEIMGSEDANPGSPYWYNLSDGWYWIDVGETQLFRYTPEASELWPPLRPACGPYVDYYLAAFFRDLLERLPAMLEPIPASLAERLSSFNEWNDWIVARDAWRAKAEEADVAIDDEVIAEGELYSDSLRWWYERSIDVGYLHTGPRIWIWNDSVNMHIGWDNRDRLLNGLPVWEAQIGQIALPIADFIQELLAFDHQFMTAMAERIVAAQDYWTDPRFANDLITLKQGQQDYTAMLANTLNEARSRPSTNWQHVLASIASYPPFPKYT